jgi:PPIC-type PPIASE domain
MKLRAIAPLGLLLSWLVLLGAGPAPKPWKPAHPLPAPPPAETAKPRRWPIVNGVPDSGQFLPDTAYLGRVNDRMLRVHDFRDGYFSSYIQYRPKEDSLGRAEFLRSMVNKEVLALTALAANKPLSFEDRLIMREHTERVLSNVAFQRFVADSAVPTPEQLQDAYHSRGFRLHLQHLVTANRASAEQARAELIANKITWAAAVRKYSRNHASPVGELGWKIYTNLSGVMARQVFSQTAGQYPPPIEDDDGFHVVRIVERQPIALPPYENVKRMVYDQVAPTLLDQHMEAMRALVRQRIGIEYDSTNIAWTSGLFGETAGVTTDASGQTVFDMNPTLPVFMPADTSRVLARWKGGRFSAGQFLEAHRATPVPQRKNVNTPDQLKAALDNIVLEHPIAELALERGLDKDPLAIALINKRREQILVEHMFEDSVQKNVWIAPAERQKYYHDHLSEFFTFRKVRFAAIVRGTSAGADSVTARLKAGAKAVDILHADSLAGLASGSIQERREDEHGSPYYKVLFEEMRTGLIRTLGPDKAGDYVVIQQLDYDPGHQLKYEEVQGIVDESLQNLKAEALLNALIARRRKFYTIDMRFDRVMLIRLTDPVTD